MAWTPPYSQADPVAGAARNVSPTEVERWTNIYNFVDDVVVEIDAARSHISNTTTAHGINLLATAASVTDHIGDATAAHAASAISYAGGTGMSATDVEAAIDELATEKSNTTHTHAVDDLSDVTITAAATGDVLRYNGTAWVDYDGSNYAAASHTHTSSTISALDAADVTTGVFDPLRLGGTGSPSGSTVLYGDGSWASPSAGSGGGVVITVASSEAPASIRARADFECDGTADQDTINAAFTASAVAGGGSSSEYGTVLLSDGVFYCSGPVLMPGRGAALIGTSLKTELRCSTSAASFVSAGQGSEKALVKLDTTAVSQNSTSLFISRMTINGTTYNTAGSSWNTPRVGGVILDASSASANSFNGGSGTVYGFPTTGTDDTYHRITDLLVCNVTYGIRFVGNGASSRGNNVHNCRMFNIANYGYSTQNASDCHFDQCHAITDTGASAVYGFYMASGSQRMTGCKAAYFRNTGSYGIYVAGDRISVDACEAQDNLNGLGIFGNDCKVTGFRAETQENPMTYGINIQGEECTIAGAQIATRINGASWGTIQYALNFANSTDWHNVVGVLIDPDNANATNAITNKVCVNNVDIGSTLASLPNGVYGITVVGDHNLVGAS